MANLRKHEEQLAIEHVPIGDLRPGPNTTRESCFMARSRLGAGGRDRGRGGQKLRGFGRGPMGAATRACCQIRPGGYAE